jgi:hypothetical protein
VTSAATARAQTAQVPEPMRTASEVVTIEKTETATNTTSSM